MTVKPTFDHVKQKAYTMKKAAYMTSICILLFSLISLSVASPPNCQQGEQLAKKTWGKWGPWKSNLEQNPFNLHVSALLSEWNSVVDHSNLPVGPRILAIDGENETGNLPGQSKNTFVTPPSFHNQVAITIHKYDGAGETGIAICTHEQNGNITKINDYNFPNEVHAKVQTFLVKNTRGKIISIAMKNNAKNKNFKFRIKAL